MPKTKKWALWGAFIGLVIGIIETVGIVHCNWNPVEGSVVPMGSCRNMIVLFWPFQYLYYVPMTIVLFASALVSSQQIINILLGVFSVVTFVVFFTLLSAAFSFGRSKKNILFLLLAMGVSFFVLILPIVNTLLNK